MTVELFLEYNFAPIIGLVFQIIILSYTRNFSKTDRKALYLAIVLEVFELVTYNIEFMFSESGAGNYSYWRTFLSVCGYLVRPMLVYPFIMLIREYGTKKSKLHYLDLIPFGILFIIECIALEPTNHLVFYFDEENIFHRGPLGYSSQVVCVFYLLEVVVQIIAATKSSRKINTLLVSTIFIYCTLAMLIESVCDIRSIGVSACIFSVDFFMFALQTNHLSALSNKLKTISEVDSLSGLSNRYYGEKTIRERLAQGETGVFVILDINKFKQINDTYGHFMGDEAIVKVSEVLKKCASERDVVMRLGGDEFAIFYSTENMDCKYYANLIISKIDEVRLSCNPDYRVTTSIGFAKVDKNNTMNFDSIYKAADSKLYIAKKHGGNYFEE